jgi:hypothetical protein
MAGSDSAVETLGPHRYTQPRTLDRYSPSRIRFLDNTFNVCLFLRADLQRRVRKVRNIGSDEINAEQLVV